MGLIDRFGESYNVRRADPGDYVKGRWIPSDTYTEIDIIASIQPMKPWEVEHQPEGQRTKEIIKIYTTNGLRPTIEAQKVKGDLISYRGRTYEVQRVETWDFVTDIPHFKAIAVLVEGTVNG